jgi:hypothetical protein
MNVSSLYIMLPASIFGAMRMSAFPRNRRIHALDLRRLLVHRDVEIQWTVHPASDDLPAVCHLGEGGGIHGRRHLRIHILDGGKNRDLGLLHLDRPRQDDSVLDNVAFLIQVWCDVDRGVANNDPARIGRRCDEHAVAEQAIRSQVALPL